MGMRSEKNRRVLVSALVIFTIVAVIFLIWELIFHNLFRDADWQTMHILFTTRGLSTALLLAAWAGYYIHNRSEKIAMQMRQADKMEALGQLTSGMAHEINNALTGVIMMADLVKRGVTRGDEMDIILNESRRASKLVSDLLAYARPQPGDKSPVHLPELARRVIRIVRNDMAIRKITVALDSPASVPPVLADENQLEQVMLNILINARQAMRSGGNIEIAVRPAGGLVELRIADSGPGIPDHVLPKIFDPFYTTKPQGEGTGLGLSVVMGIVKGHGGSITAENREQGGARFVIRLPAASGAADESARADSSADTDIAGLAVLIVDDEPAVLAACSRALESAGARVTAALGVGCAINYLDSGHFDVVLSDYAMPGRTGLDLFEYLEKAGRSEARSFILITGMAPRDIHADVRVLAKPVDSGELIDAVAGAARPNDIRSGAARAEAMS